MSLFKKSLFFGISVLLCSVTVICWNHATRNGGVKSFIAEILLERGIWRYISGEKSVDEKYVQVHLKEGLPIFLPKERSDLYYQIRLKGYTSKATHDTLLSFVQPQHTVVQIGAEYGHLTLPLAHAVGTKGQVIAYEVRQQPLNMLRKSLALNALDPRVTLRRKAISDQNFEGFVVEDGREAYVLEKDSAPLCHRNSMCMPVDVTTLDQDLPQQKVDILYIDAQGLEASILKGSEVLRKRNPEAIIVIETYADERMAAQNIAIFQELMEQGYTLYALTPESQLSALREAVDIKSGQTLVLSRHDLLADKRN